MRTFMAGMISTLTAAVLGVGAMQGTALAQGGSGTPSAGDAGVAAGQTVLDVLDALRSGHHSNSSNPGVTY
jgi:hypothetical protein